MNNYLILLAGGSGTRLNLNKSKGLIKIFNNKTLLEYSLNRICNIIDFHTIIVVAKQDNFQDITKITTQFSKKCIVTTGGKRRQDSVYNGIKIITEICKPHSDDICFIHNVANPFIEKNEINKLYTFCQEMGASTLGLKSINTLRKVDNLNLGLKLLNRDSIWEIQTPQALKFGIINKALDHLKSGKTITDDVQMAELIGIKPKIVKTSKINFKITTKEDLQYAKYLIENNLV